jgi:hypothetical protein
VIPGTGGFRKLRWTDPRRRKGKRGGLRVIYFHFAEDRLGEALGLPQVVAQVSKATQGGTGSAAGRSKRWRAFPPRPTGGDADSSDAPRSSGRSRPALAIRRARFSRSGRPLRRDFSRRPRRIAHSPSGIKGVDGRAPGRAAPVKGAHDAASLEASHDAASLERSHAVAGRWSGGGAGIGGGSRAIHRRQWPETAGEEPGGHCIGATRREAGPAEKPERRLRDPRWSRLAAVFERSPVSLNPVMECGQRLDADRLPHLIGSRLAGAPIVWNGLVLGRLRPVRLRG